jgi:polysaccharide export outer membrane protein
MKYSFILKKSILLVLVSIFLFSCVSRKKMVYYRNIESMNNKEMTNSYEIKIQPDDLLMIIVSCDDPEIAKPFNIGAYNSMQTSSSNQQLGSTYLVDVNGAIDFPVLGKLTIGGMTRTQVMKMLNEKISLYIKKPLITLTIKNYKVTVQGEVVSPGIYSFDSERFTLVDALIKAGDLKIQAKRKNILIIRQTDGVITYNRVDITKADFINSPFYYLRQNDMVYVQPNRLVLQGAARSRETTFLFSAVASFLTYLIFNSIRK